MNKLFKIASRQLIIVLGACALTFGLSAQKKSKTFTEKFTVSKDAVLDINTSYADIEFETWNKDIVAVVVLIELEGATDKEAETYFEQEPIEIMGNSKKVTIATNSQKSGLFPRREVDFDFEDFDIDIPEITSFAMDMSEIGSFPEMMEMPPLPMTKSFKFDYKEYKKDGEVYMKKWQKNFEKSFDKEHQKRLEEWGEKMDKRSEEFEERMEEREEMNIERLEKRTEALAKISEKREKVMVQRLRGRDSIRFFRTDSIRTSPNTFYFLSEGRNKNYKIKKTIKIKLPKSTRIQMNVRHGEVKLAENAKNLNATLSHSSLWASNIDGKETNISVSYSPISVQRWNRGQLQTNYSRSVSLAKVINLQLRATSSDVTIDHLMGKAFVKNDFGPLVITSLGETFEELDISLKNAELTLGLPSKPTTIYIKGTGSELTIPRVLQLKATKNGNTTLHKGNHIGGNGTASIVITSAYSDVVLQN